jgi:FO synthase
MLAAGVNDLGGVLMNESITRAAGAAHGQMWIPKDIEQAIVLAGRMPVQRNTRYEPAVSQRSDQLSGDAIRWVSHTPAGRYANPKYNPVI